MTARHGKSFQEKGLSLALWSAAAAFLSVALVFSAVSGVEAQVIPADPAQPFPIFQKEPRFESLVHVQTSNAALSVTQSYNELIKKLDSARNPIGSAEIDYSLGVSLEGRSVVLNSISSLPFRPGGPVFNATTIMGADVTEPAKALVAAEKFSFSACDSIAQRGSAVGLGLNTRLIKGKAVSQVEFDTVSQQFEGSYLGDGIGAAGIGTAVAAGSGAGSSQSYSGSISVEGDFRVSYSVSSGPTAGCFWGP